MDDERTVGGGQIPANKKWGFVDINANETKNKQITNLKLERKSTNGIRSLQANCLVPCGYYAHSDVHLDSSASPDHSPLSAQLRMHLPTVNLFLLKLLPTHTHT